MNRKIFTRRDFLRAMGVTAVASVLHGCAPIGTPLPAETEFPAATEGPTPLKIVYPRKDTKVTNPSVNFQWESTDKWFVLEVFVMKKNSDAESYFWELAFSAVVNTTNYDYAQINGHPLDQGFHYYWQVTSYNNEIPLPPIDAYTLPVDIVLDDEKNEDQQEPIPHPTRDRLEGEIGFDSGIFFLKPWKNYLAAYLNRVTDLSPIVSLVYYFLDRYNKSECKDCGDCPSEPICISFPKTTAVMKDIPPEMLEKILYNFADAGVSIPEEEDSGWMESQIQRLFEGTVFEEIRNVEEENKKTIDVKINGERFWTSSPDDPTSFQLLSQSFIDREYIHEGEECTLTFSGNAQMGSSISETLVVKIGDDGMYYLYPYTSRLNELDSADFEVLLRLPNGEEMRGYANVRGGGPPILLEIIPSDATEGQSDINIVVRNGCNGERIILWDASSSDPSSVYTVAIPISKGEQTLYYQKYTFNLTGMEKDTEDKEYLITNGDYNVIYRNTEGNESNELPFRVKGQEYTVEVNTITCIDESNPEWAGNDSICFSTLINTEHFVQYAFTSQVYDGFYDGYSKGTFDNDDEKIYHRSDPKVGSIDGRIIEINLSISMGIFEYDDWGWLGWLIDKIIDIVQSILEDIIDIFTWGLGGLLIEMGLEASGVNRMREQAINAMVTGFEFELICEGTTTTYVDNGVLVLPALEARGEAGYTVEFSLEQV